MGHIEKNQTKSYTKKDDISISELNHRLRSKIENITELNLRLRHMIEDFDKLINAEFNN